MSKYPFPQIDNVNFASMPRREGVAVDSTAIHPSNKGSEQNLITRTGDATLADFVVPLVRNTMYSFSRKPKNQTQGRGLQLVERGV